MVKIVTVSQGVYPEHRGGSPLYNHYLSKVFGAELCSYSSRDFPQTKPVPEHLRAWSMNICLEQKGYIKRGDIVIGDGVWGNYGLDDSKYKLVSICHGVWAGTLNISDPRVEIQAEGYRRSRLVVAVSPFAAENCHRFCQVS